MTKTKNKPAAAAVAPVAAAAAVAAVAAVAADDASTELLATPAVPRGYWEAADGSLVPASKVQDVDKARDKVVRDLIAAAQDMSTHLADFKRQAMEEVARFIDRSAAEYNATIRGAAGKGNVTLTTYDGRFKVEKQVAERIAFDERLQVAKSLVDACLQRWGKGANHNIQAVVQHAFKVDKAGRVSVGAVLGLRAVKITDDDWQQAMKAVADSTHAVSSVAYLRFYRRDDATGKYLPISLDMASV